MNYNLRPALFEDRDWIRDFANLNRRYSLSKKRITIEEHEIWYQNNKEDIQIIYNPVVPEEIYGLIRKDSSRFIHISLYSKYQNQGLGTSILKNIDGQAIVLCDNIKSQKAFTKAGFEITGFLFTKQEEKQNDK